jgi:DNA-directed RNA polymerase specialized sigma24 family protein
MSPARPRKKAGRPFQTGDVPTANQVTEFEHRLERYYRESCNVQIRRFLSMGTVDEIRGAIHEVLAELLDRYLYGDPPPENLGGFVHVAVRRKLLDGIREEARKVPIDNVRIGRSGQTIIEREEDQDSAPASDLPDRRVTQEDAAAWKELYRTIFDRLPPKSHEVAKMAMLGVSPEEIGKRFEQNGYVLRRYARTLICRILMKLAEAGDPLAHGVAREICPKS